MDFVNIKHRLSKSGSLEIYPDFIVCKPKDFMVKGHAFYAIWNEKTGLWSKDEYDVLSLVDGELAAYAEMKKESGYYADVKWLRSYDTGSWKAYKDYISKMPDTSHTLDNTVTFSNTEVRKEDYVSRRLPYPLEEGRYSAYEEIISTLYDPEERAKIEWAIGSIIAGDGKDIQKFIVFYGEQGAGKSTILKIIEQVFEGYCTFFDAKSLTGSNNTFSTESFRDNPLVAIQHDGDLSKIEDNAKLNSIISHEYMEMHEKYKPSYKARINAFLFMATNRPVKITDAKSGIIRRLIEVKPSGRLVPSKRYDALMQQIPFELSGIAWHCLQVYREMGKNYYQAYRPLDMMFKTDAFFNFVEENYDTFKEQDGISLKAAYSLYKEYCAEAKMNYILEMYKFREELKNYFEDFFLITRVDGKQIRSYYKGFKSDKFFQEASKKYLTDDGSYSLVLDKTSSILDDILKDCPAQYATDDGIPSMKWDKCETTLKDIQTNRLHFVKVPVNHIVIDFDLKNEKGEKDYEKNLREASKFPATYAEVSKSGAGIHLHYIYDGDPEKLKNVYSDGIEIKVFKGNSALRRRVITCNNVPVATINSGLPLKGENEMINFKSVQSEKGIRTLIAKNLNKEIHPGTKPSVEFIFKILEDAYNNGLSYDVTNLRPKILAFANNSTNHSKYCVELVNRMKFKSDDVGEEGKYENDILAFYDCEVFPNLFIVCYKMEGNDKPVVKMINPSPTDIESLFNLKLVGFNCRRYDNHILYASMLGYNNRQLFELSQSIINGGSNCFFGEAYNISYTDVYDFSTKKQSLKKWEIELGIHHQENAYKWDKDVPESAWEEIAEYCCNDVLATEAVFYHLSADWIARKILSSLSGLSYNSTTNQHTTKIIFGDDKNPQELFEYTDLSEMFPGYTFDRGVSRYHGEEVGEGGYVYSEPGMYGDVALLAIASMHPTSIEQLNLFGPYTKKFSDIKSARIAIKHNDIPELHKLLDGKLIPFIEEAESGNSDFTMKDLAYALKIAINSVYGLTAAKFDNKFKDPRNVDNIVAKRGALFMVDLKNAVQEKGWKVAHIKTDSIKIPDATQEIIDFVMEFGKKYGYIFEHEATYDKLCLVNDAVYIAKYKGEAHEFELSTGEKILTQWTATGTQFQVPYVFKTLFADKEIVFRDLCETKSVKTALYLDMNENLQEGEHDYKFIGKVGSFCPIIFGRGGGELLTSREIEKDGNKEIKYYSVTGTKGYRWLESEDVKNLGKKDDIDISYYEELASKAKDAIEEYGDFNWFIEDAEYNGELPVTDKTDFSKYMNPPIYPNDPNKRPCGSQTIGVCNDCPNYISGLDSDDGSAKCKKGFSLREIDLLPFN